VLPASIRLARVGSEASSERKPDATGLKLLCEAADAMRLSAHGYTRVLRVARTLADLDGAATVSRVHLAEAISYRTLIDEVRRAAVA
jgi:magnesium chelatase family protein